MHCGQWGVTPISDIDTEEMQAALCRYVQVPESPFKWLTRFLEFPSVQLLMSMHRGAREEYPAAWESFFSTI